MAEDKVFDVPGSVSIVSTGKKTVQEKEAFEQAIEPQSTGITLSEIYDRYSRLLYVVDASGSMGEGMQQEDRANQYLWPASTLLKFRQAMAEGENEVAEDYADELEYKAMPSDGMSDEELKNYVVDNNLDDKFSIPLRRNPGYRTVGRSKMMAVKEAARDFVAARFKKFPDALVTLFAFEGSPRLLSNGASESDVLRGIDKLPDGGGGSTDIYRAVERALNDCEAHPSSVKRHHIVLVSDGLDSGAMGVPRLLPRMKSNGVVFDFIFILGASGMEAINPDVLECLKAVCEATGGEFQTVKTEKDFTQKFLAASNRKMLPAYAGKP